MKADLQWKFLTLHHEFSFTNEKKTNLTEVKTFKYVKPRSHAQLFQLSLNWIISYIIILLHLIVNLRTRYMQIVILTDINQVL